MGYSISCTFDNSKQTAMTVRSCKLLRLSQPIDNKILRSEDSAAFCSSVRSASILLFPSQNQLVMGSCLQSLVQFMTHSVHC